MDLTARTCGGQIGRGQIACTPVSGLGSMRCMTFYALVNSKCDMILLYKRLCVLCVLCMVVYFPQSRDGPVSPEGDRMSKTKRFHGHGHGILCVPCVVVLFCALDM
jgi:hypothetical protein